MTKIAPFLLCTVFAAPAIAGSGAPDGAAARSHDALRAMAEIDADPDTFTEDERAKLALLRQVLGTVPTAPRDRVASASEVNGALDAEAPGP